MRKQPLVDILNRIEAQLVSQASKPLAFDEAAKYLHISKSYLYRLTSRSEIPHYKPSGKKIFFEKRDLDRYLLRNKVKSNEEVRQEVESQDRKVKGHSK